MNAVESIKGSLSLSDYGITYQRLWERTRDLPGAMTEDEFRATLAELEAREAVERRIVEARGRDEERYFLKA